MQQCFAQQIQQKCFIVNPLMPVAYCLHRMQTMHFLCNPMLPEHTYIFRQQGVNNWFNDILSISCLKIINEILHKKILIDASVSNIYLFVPEVLTKTSLPK